MSDERAKSEAGPAKSALGIRARLMILAVIAILPLLADRLHDIEVDRASRIAEAHRRAQSLARQAMTLQNEIFVTARAFLQVADDAYVTADMSCDEFVRSNAGQLPWMKSISVLTPDGTVICSSRSQQIGAQVAGLAHFERAKATGQFALGQYFYNPVPGPSIFAAHPYRSADGRTIAIISANLDLDWFGRLTATVGEEHKSVVMLFDDAGTLLAEHPHRETRVGMKFKDHPMVQTFFTKSEGLFTGECLDGIRRIFGFVRLPGTDARFAIGFDEAEVLGPINTRTREAIAQLGAFTLLVLLAIWFGGERMFVRPIRQMAERAQRLGRGELEPRTQDGPWVTELVPLAAALDDMVDQLSAREQELHDRNSQLHELARIDGLTGLANRGAFNARLAMEWQAALEGCRPIALLMIDVDHFKAFNDRHGHIEGDACLRRIADALKAGARLVAAVDGAEEMTTEEPGRSTDFAARYGGEEFAVLLQDASFETAMLAAERLRNTIHDLRIPHAGAPLGFVTVSIGVSSMTPTKQDSSQRLVEAADAGLYAAKRHGRNKVMARASFVVAEAGIAPWGTGMPRGGTRLSRL